ncbi:MAG: MaoC family dehydratase N-terminal domain-containing protein [Candidatus Nanopelagicales bacterium]
MSAAADSGLIGKTYPPSKPYEVSREKIREFADAIGDQNPAFRDVEAAKALGHPDVIAPPTFPFVIAFRASEAAVFDPEVGIDYSRVVHGEQRFVYTRPVRAGDRLVALVRIDSLRVVAGNRILGTATDLATDDGEPVVTAYSTIVSRGSASGES